MFYSLSDLDTKQLRAKKTWHIKALDTSTKINFEVWCNFEQPSGGTRALLIFLCVLFFGFKTEFKQSIPPALWTTGGLDVFSSKLPLSLPLENSDRMDNSAAARPYTI